MFNDFINMENVILSNKIIRILPLTFCNNDKISRIVGNDVKYVMAYGIRELSNLKVIEFPNLVSMKNLFGCSSLEYMVYGVNTEIRGVSRLNENLRVKILDSEYVVSDNILCTLDKFITKDDNFFIICIDDRHKLFTLPGINNNKDIGINDKIIANEKLLTNLAKIEKQLRKLPKDIIDSILEEGYKIIIINFNLGNKAGFTLNTVGEIYISANDLDDNTLLHEIGHVYDYIHGDISESERFLEIYLKEVNNMYTIYDGIAQKINFCFNKEIIRYVRSNTCEYFAEAFARYFDEPEKLIIECPLTYEFLNEMFSFNRSNVKSRKLIKSNILL